MKILLAGYNIDYETIQDIEDALPELEELTPETIAAAYARISRNPKPVHELRAVARAEVEKARQSNRNIVFDMGHSSIAEHAVFNGDYDAAAQEYAAVLNGSGSTEEIRAAQFGAAVAHFGA